MQTFPHLCNMCPGRCGTRGVQFPSEQCIDIFWPSACSHSRRNTTQIPCNLIMLEHLTRIMRQQPSELTTVRDKIKKTAFPKIPGIVQTSCEPVKWAFLKSPAQPSDDNCSLTGIILHFEAILIVSAIMTWSISGVKDFDRARKRKIIWLIHEVEIGSVEFCIGSILEKLLLCLSNIATVCVLTI